MTRSNRFILASLALLGLLAFLGGCSNPEGYSENAPPAGGPKQNAHVPPGEKPASPSTSSAAH